MRVRAVAFVGSAALTAALTVHATNQPHRTSTLTSPGVTDGVVTDLRWLPAALRTAGLTVIEEPGWRTRGHTTRMRARAVILHHDASPTGPTPSSTRYLIAGFASGRDKHYDAQVWVDRTGRWHLIAAGSAQHAGTGTGWGAVRGGHGNEDAFGVETDHTTGEAWPAKQLASITRGLAVICARLGWNPNTAVLGHKEYAPGRKPDPAGIDMGHLRQKVTAQARELAVVIVVAAARAAGCWRGERLVEAVAVALAESGGRPDARGDTRITDRTWGPSVGLWQIRSFRAQHGTGGVRDEVANADPVTNAKHACSIWRDRGWAPWSTWEHGTHRKYLPRARAAVR